MSAPLIGMSFSSFFVLLIISGIAAGVVHWQTGYRLFDGFDGFVGQWMFAWIGAWLGPPVLGHWFGFFMLAGIYLFPAFIGGFAGAFAAAANAKVIAGARSLE
jgi:hypothetical protein